MIKVNYIMDCSVRGNSGVRVPTSLTAAAQSHARPHITSYIGQMTANIPTHSGALYGHGQDRTQGKSSLSHSLMGALACSSLPHP